MYNPVIKMKFLQVAQIIFKRRPVTITHEFYRIHFEELASVDSIIFQHYIVEHDMVEKYQSAFFVVVAQSFVVASYKW